MTRTAAAKAALEEAARKAVADHPQMQLEADEVTANDDHPYRLAEEACAVVVDCGSGEGHVQISGGGKETVKVKTGRRFSGYEFREIPEGQSCMLWGWPTAWFLRKKP